MPLTDGKSSHPAEPPVKKPYSPPKLTTYGDLGALTRTSAIGGSIPDAGSPGDDKTA
jgi:hypothetical protein